MANLLAKAGGGNIFFLYTVIVWESVLISAFIDNIPHVATMIPVIAGIASALGADPTVLYFGLLSGATLGGNCTPSVPLQTLPESVFSARKATLSKTLTSSRSVFPSPLPQLFRRISICGSYSDNK